MEGRPSYKGRVIAYLLATLHTARRTPLLVLLAGLGLASVAVGLGLGIFALTSDPEGERRLALESVVGTAALAISWLLVRALEGDLRSGFCVAADATRGGVAARLMGRWVGALCAAIVVAVPAGAAASAWTEATPMLLLVTTISSAALQGAWVLLLASAGLASVALWLVVALVWLLGHLPWGAPGWGGTVGGWIAGWLPPGLAEDGVPRLSAWVATAGCLLVALGAARAAGASRRAASP
jgi:hypothetical protein